MKRIAFILILILGGCQLLDSSFKLSNTINSIAIGGRTTYIVTDSKTLYALGEVGSKYVNEPTPIMSNIEHIYSEWNTTIALDTNGSLWEWGKSRIFSYLPTDKQNEPVRVLEDVKNVWGNQSRVIYVLKNDDSLWVIGNDECRVKSSIPNESTNPKELSKVLEGVKDVIVQPHSSNAIVRMLDGRFYMWGAKTSNNKTKDVISLFLDEGVSCQSTPIEVSFDFNIKHLIYDHQALLFITEDDSLYGLGNNSNYRLNNSSETMLDTPYKITDDVKDVQTSAISIYILKRDNTLYELVNELLPSNSDATGVYLTSILGNVDFVSSGVGSTIAKTKDGIIYGWGNNEYNQLGNTFDKIVSKPTKIGQSRP